MIMTADSARRPRFFTLAGSATTWMIPEQSCRTMKVVDLVSRIRRIQPFRITGSDCDRSSSRDQLALHIESPHREKTKRPQASCARGLFR